VLGKFFTRAYPVSRPSMKEGFSNCGWWHGWRLPLQVSPSTIFRHAETLAPIDSHNQGRCGFLVAAQPGKTRPIDNVAT
jgi:hypothetical protein